MSAVAAAVIGQVVVAEQLAEGDAGLGLGLYAELRAVLARP